MIKRRLQQIQTLIKETCLYTYLKFIKKEGYKEKVLLVNFENPNLYHRFFYLLLKMYNLSGYTIVYPMNFSRFRNLRNGDRYLALILQEKDFLSIRKMRPSEKFVEINDHQFNENYFKNYFADNNTEEAFHVPMSFHPYMYHNDLWNYIYEEKKRINSILCYGNFDTSAYLQIDDTGFKVASRTAIKNSLAQKQNFVSIANKQHLEDLIGAREEEKIIFVEKTRYALQMHEIFDTVSNFWFHLCCPGVVMPLCHNVVEAMYSGAIPIIEHEYAKVMYPNLIHMENAIIFSGIDGLKETIENIVFSLSEQQKETMSENVKKYYHKNLSPEAVVQNVNKNLGARLIYINAEHRSVRHIPSLINEH